MMPQIITRTYLLRVTSIELYEKYFLLKSDPSAILWSGFKSGPDKEKLRHHFKKLVANPGFYLYFLLDEDTSEIIGYGQLDREGEDTAHYSGVSVLTKYQGQGYSKLISRLLMIEAKKHGFKQVYAWISENNIPSIRSYESNNFKKTNIQKMVNLEALQREDRFFLYERKL